jgi:hypothetical protein
MARYRVLSDGEWRAFRGRYMKIGCCDCKLVHWIEFERAPKAFRAWRDNRATARRRTLTVRRFR